MLDKLFRYVQKLKYELFEKNDGPQSEPPVVSIIIPTFNYGHYLEDLATHLDLQTYEKIEILYVEGGSTDGKTPQALEKITSKRFPVRKLVSKNRMSVVEAREWGLSAATGKYAIYLDSDDFLEPTYIEMAVFLAESRGLELVCGHVRQFWEGDSFEKDSVVPFDFWATQGPAIGAIPKDNTTPITAMFRKSFVERTGIRFMRDKQLAEDWDYWCQMATAGIRFSVLKGPTHYYRVHGKSATSRWSRDEWQAGLEEIRIRYRDYLRKPLLRRWIEARQNFEVRRAIVHHKKETAEKNWIIITIPYFVLGGMEKVLFNRLSELKSAGYSICLVHTEAPPEGYLNRFYLAAGQADLAYNAAKFTDPRDLESFLVYLSAKLKPEALYLINSRATYGALDRIRPNIRGKVIDQHFNSVGFVDYLKTQHQFIDISLVESDELKTTFEKLVPHHNFAVVPNQASMKPLPIEGHGWKTSHLKLERFLLFVGRLSFEKGPDIFLKIIDRLKNDHPDLHGIVCGSGPVMSLCFNIADQCGVLDRIHFLGESDPTPFMEKAEALLVPSRIDGRPNVVLEAMKANVPIIAFDVGNIRQMTESYPFASVVPLGDFRDFEDKVREVLTAANIQRSTTSQSSNVQPFAAPKAAKALADYFSRPLENVAEH